MTQAIAACFFWRQIARYNNLMEREMTPKKLNNIPVTNKKKPLKIKKTNISVSIFKRIVRTICRSYVSGCIETSKKPGIEYFYMFFD